MNSHHTVKRKLERALGAVLAGACLVGLSPGRAGLVERAAPRQPDAGGVVYEYRKGPIRSIVVVGDSYLSVASLKALYQSLVTADLPRHHEVSVYAYPDGSSDLWAWGGRHLSPGGPSFDGWREEVLKVRREKPWKASRLLSTIDGVVIQVASDGECSHRVLSGADPTLLMVDGQSVELLWTRFYQRPHMSETYLEAWVKAEPLPTLAGAEHITKAIRTKFGEQEVEVSIRPDTWYVYDTFFPVWFPFCKRQEPPTWEEFRHTKEIYCRGGPSWVACHYPSIPSSPRTPYGGPE